ncbi:MULTISPECIES: glutamine synthetase family protein [unclassified Meridianimarinicoccus]|uniref:glutamine synthetase family protein n=1 Tax=unclassified Meridianimarinicoccus TaxID=2923344 RepID=UPI0018672A5D|nr:glutamine synthetase family protein [Fluviibacterium sp. MJW13]
MAPAPSSDWQAALPAPFLTYRGDRRLEEVECIVPDLVGSSRGKAMPSHKFSPEQTYALPTSLFYETVSGEYVDIAGIENQWTEVDMVLRPDMSTASAVPWAADATLQVICDLEDRHGNPVSIAPRNVLKRVLDRYAEHGWQPIVAPELEFYLISPNLDWNDPVKPPVGRTGRPGSARQAYSMVAVDEYGEVIDTIYDYAEDQGLHIDTLIQEGGAGQIEINLMHGDPMALADQVFYFKRAIREAALKHKFFATFMAKPMRDQPGSAMHIHQSVLDKRTGQNIFSNPDGSESEAFYHFIGGSQRHLMEVMPLIAPYVNSHRRLTGGMSAPTNMEWGHDNRTTGLRIPNARPEARRVENRVIGIDANPYLALAASLAAGLKGMTDRIAPRRAAQGEIWTDGAILPEGPFDMLAAFNEAHEMRALLGAEFCAVLSAIKLAELNEFQREISPWERKHLLLNV